MALNINVVDRIDAYYSFYNSVAMFFGGTTTGLFNSIALIGALLGLISLLLYMLNKTAGANLMEHGGFSVATPLYFIVPLFFLAAGGIKTDITLTSLKTGSVRTVSNVPVMLAMPASLVTTMVERTKTPFITAVQTAGLQYVPATEGGMSGLVKFFYEITRSPVGDPYAAATIKSFIKDCTIGSTVSEQGLKESLSVVEYLATNGNNGGLTSYYSATNPDGLALSCSEAKTKLNAYTTFSASNNSVTSVLTNAYNKAMDVQNTSSITSTTFNTVADNLLNNITGVAQSNNQLLSNLYFGASAVSAMECKGVSDLTAYKQCTDQTSRTMMSSFEKEFTGATYFSTMMTSILVGLEILAIAVFPLLFLFLLLKPWNGLKSYVTWCALLAIIGVWQLAAEIGNAYLHYTIQAFFESASSPKGFSADPRLALGGLMKELTVVAQLISMTPAIAAAIVTGSFLGLAGGSKERMDTNGAAPKMDGSLSGMGGNVYGSAPALKGATQMTHAASGPNANMIMDSTRGGAHEYSFGAGADHRMASANALKESAQKDVSQASDNARTIANSNRSGSQQAHNTMSGLAATYSDSYQRARGVAEQIAKDRGLNKEDSEAFVNSFTASIAGGVKTPGASPVQAALGADLKLANNQGTRISKAEAEKYGTALNDLKSSTEGFQKAWNAASNDQFSKYSAQERSQMLAATVRLGEAKSKAESADRSFQMAASQSEDLKRQGKFDEYQGAVLFAENKGAQAMVQAAATEAYAKDRAGFGAAVERHSARLNKLLSNADENQQAQIRNLATLAALNERDRNKAGEVIAALGGVAPLTSNARANENLAQDAQRLLNQKGLNPEGAPNPVTGEKPKVANQDDKPANAVPAKTRTPGTGPGHSAPAHKPVQRKEEKPTETKPKAPASAPTNRENEVEGLIQKHWSPDAKSGRDAAVKEKAAVNEKVPAGIDSGKERVGSKPAELTREDRAKNVTVKTAVNTVVAVGDAAVDGAGKMLAPVTGMVKDMVGPDKAKPSESRVSPIIPTANGKNMVGRGSVTRADVAPPKPNNGQEQAAAAPAPAQAPAQVPAQAPAQAPAVSGTKPAEPIQASLNMNGNGEGKTIVQNRPMPSAPADGAGGQGGTPQAAPGSRTSPVTGNKTGPQRQR